MPRGGSARDRRSARRAAERTEQEQLTEISQLALVAAASGSTSLPLSDRDTGWDAAAASKSLSETQLPSAFFWKDPDGDPKAKSSYKLGFASVEGGTLTAIWKGVTAAAGAVQGARGGVSIPSGDVAGVKAKIESYYAKAAKQYDDDTITPPWDASKAEAALELGGVGVSVEEIDEVAVLAELTELALEELADQEAEPEAECADCGHAFDLHAGATGPCTAEGCECDGFVAPDEMSLEASGDENVLVAIEDGVIVSYQPTATLMEQAIHTLTGDFPEAEQLIRARLEELFESAFAETRLPESNGHDVVITPAEDQPVGASNDWNATLLPEATLTDDGRAIAPGATRWRDLPLSLMGLIETSAAGGHDKAVLCGRIDNIWREANLVRANGVFDNGEYGQEIARLVGDETLRGNSVDLAIHSYEIVRRSDYFDADGNWLDTPPADIESVDLYDSDADDLIFLITDCVIGMSTVCPFPAFAGATIEIGTALVAGAETPKTAHVSSQAGFIVTPHKQTADEGPTWRFATSGVDVASATASALGTLMNATGISDISVTLTAAAAGLAPVAPPVSWFADPQLTELTPLTVTEDGRIYGHAWSWDTCHIGIPDVCQTAPSSDADYAYFLLKTVLADDGTEIPCGTITLDAPHADRRLRRVEATAHYDNTGLAAADVTVGEDEFGGWIAGALRPDISEEKARALRGAAVSGDWRFMDGNLELVALLAVNVPGFPVPRPKALVSSGADNRRVVSLVAAGIVQPHEPELTVEDEIALEAVRALSTEV